MRATRVFRTIWRANALLILVAGLLAVVLLALATVQVGKEVFRTREVRAVVNTDQVEAKERLSLASGQRLPGSHHVLVALQSNQDYQQAYFSKSAQAIRNYAFISLSGQPTWVYPHNRFLFSEAIVLPRAAYGREPQAAQAVLLVVRQQDSDGDRRLTYRDVGVIGLAKPDGAGFKEVISDVVRLVSHEVAGDSVLLVFESSRGPYTASVSLNDFSVVNKGPLPLPGAGLTD